MIAILLMVYERQCTLRIFVKTLRYDKHIKASLGELTPEVGVGNAVTHRTQQRGGQTDSPDHPKEFIFFIIVSLVS